MASEMSLMHQISIISRCSMRYRDEKLEEDGVSAVQSRYIMYVCNHPGVPQDTLAELLYVNKSSVTRQLSMLEQNGMIERKQDDRDLRVQRVYPTEKAQALLPKIRSVLRTWNEYLTDEFTDEEKEILDRLVTKARERATEYMQAGGGRK